MGAFAGATTYMGLSRKGNFNPKRFAALELGVLPNYHAVLARG